tara:strand:+ start:113 stop:1222 length:1110 start_codon:yes stop_codon:yes gene_type:complete
MPIISDGNNQTGDELSDRHSTVGTTKHTGSYHISGSSGNYVLVNSDDMTMQMSVAPGGANMSAAPHLGVFDNTAGIQPTIAIGRGDNTKTHGGQFALTRFSSTGSVGPGDILGSIAAYGHDGTDFNLGAEIRFGVDGNVSTDVMPSKIEFMTNPGSNTTVFPATAMTVESNGNIGIGTSGQSSKLSVNGHVAIGEYVLPTSDGSSGHVLMTDGGGNVTFQQPSATGGLFAQGHVEVDTTAKPVNWSNVVSIGASAAGNIKSWFISPYAGTLSAVILSVKSNNFTTSNDGTVQVDVYLNQPSFVSRAATASVAADSFNQTVSNFEGGSSDLNTATFSSLNVSVAPGDLIQIKVSKTSGSVKDAIVTLLFS